MPIRRRRRFFALGEDQRRFSPSVEPQPSDDPNSPVHAEEEPEDNAADPDFFEPALEGAESAEDTSFAVKALTERRLKSWRRVSFPLATGLAVLSAGLGGLAVHLLSRPADHPVRIGMQSNMALLMPGDQEELDAAYAARDARRFDEAEARFTALAGKHPNWSALPLEIGRTLLHRQNYLGARAALNGALVRGEDSAAANVLTGVAYDAEKSYPEAEASFARAVALDPTQADAYFVWGECLRAQGKLTDAVARYRSALLRNEDETGAGLYRLKLWLCEIESGKVDPGTNADIDAALARPYPPMEALFAAAARELKAGNLQTAAAHLVRARERTDPPIFLAVLNDPLFVEARSTPELSEMVRSLPPAPPAKSAATADVPVSPVAAPTKKD